MHDARHSKCVGLLVIVLAMAGAAAALGQEEPSAGTVQTQLAHGVIVRIVAVAESRLLEPTRWWRPDGTPCAAVPIGEVETGVSGSIQAQRIFVVDLAEMRPGSTVILAVRGPGGNAPRVLYPQGGRVRRAVHSGFAATTETATVRVGVASGPWTAAARTDGRVPVAVGMQDGGVAFSPAWQSGGDTYVSVYHGLGDRDWRLVAEGKDGALRVLAEHGARSLGSQYAVGRWVGDAPDQVAEYRLELRSWEWVEFSGVAVQPLVETSEAPNYVLNFAAPVPLGGVLLVTDDGPLAAAVVKAWTGQSSEEQGMQFRPNAIVILRPRLAPVEEEPVTAMPAD